MTGDLTDRAIRELRALAEQAAASVAPLDLAAHEAAVVRETRQQLDRERADPPQGIDWARTERLARAVSARQRR